eukprot:TRINITY_DN4614_c0_g2_i1.p1 TRINITY_DN4614_c0_g2~~TRINITY_DN4614_c0_g2_i1.p1  ORF type:complete len:217 (-),score=3.48 TRINITY_DN4614_c0_g2_i1:647-1297(-)
MAFGVASFLVALLAAVVCSRAVDYQSFPSGQWSSVATNITCHPNCSMVSFFNFRNITFMMSRASSFNGSNPANKIFMWNNNQWEESVSNAGTYGTPPQCSINWCFFSSGGALSRINPLDQNLTRRVLSNLPNPPIFPRSWTSGRVSDVFYVDPLDRWIVFLGGIHSSNVLMLNLSTLNYSVVTSTFMPPPLSGSSDGILLSPQNMIFYHSYGTFCP